MVSLASPTGAMPPPATPLKRPTLTMKRDSSYLDADDQAGLSSRTKKLRVAFNPNVDVHVMDDWAEKSSRLVKEEVCVAIQQHTAVGDQKNDTQYLRLLQTLDHDPFSDEAPSSKLLQKYLVAIDSRISSLGECAKLAVAAIDISWLGRNEKFVSVYVKCLCDLASAHTKFIPVMLEKLVQNFARLPASLGQLPNEEPISRSAMFSRLHSVIEVLLHQSPSASSSLMKIARQLFPNDLEPSKTFLQYQKHLLRLAENVPELKAGITTYIVQRLVELDVQIQQDIEDLEEEAEESLLQKRLVTNDANAEDSDDSDIESESESEETMTEDEQRLRELRLKVTKMDGTLDLLFEYYTSLIEGDGRSESLDAYRQLLSHFSTFILPTRSRHTQFLLFHFSQRSPVLTGLFVEMCLQLVLQNNGNSTQRLTACAYISSFVARGAHLSSSTVQNTVGALCQSLDNMRQKYEPTCRGPDRRTYSLYYAVAQALLYIFCFRWRDLVTGSAGHDLGTEFFNEDDAIADGQELAWLPGLKETMLRNVYCSLNPLKVCSQAIVSEFAKIANYLRFLYVFPKLETNKRVRLGQTYSYYGVGGLVDIGRRETAWDRKKGETHHQLEAYFPFDPYHLPTSKRWIADDYNEWKLPSGMEQDDDGHSESEEGESDEESLPEDLQGFEGVDTLSSSS